MFISFNQLYVKNIASYQVKQYYSKMGHYYTCYYFPAVSDLKFQVGICLLSIILGNCLASLPLRTNFGTTDFFTFNMFNKFKLNWLV